jgi:hypothetical protein
LLGFVFFCVEGCCPVWFGLVFYKVWSAEIRKNMLKFDCHIKGISPLLFNRYPEEDNADQKSKGKKAVGTKDEQVEKSLYHMTDGKIYQPSEHVLGAMIKAATNFKLEGKKTYKDVVKGGVFIEPMQIKHLKQKYESDWRSVVIKATGGRVMKGRARMNEWELKFTLTCIDERSTEQDMRDILAYAGSYLGIGDYRPRYGRFEVMSMVKI